MFTNPLPSDDDFRVVFSDYAQRHFIRRFAKDYRGKRWLVTQDSIFQDMKRIHALQKSQQVDELKHKDNFWLIKYDFAIAQSNTSPKASGNRCIIFLDISRRLVTVLLAYGKGDLPKNIKETQFVLHTVRQEFADLWEKLS